MSKLIVLILLIPLGLSFGCASITGKTAGEHIDDATITAAINLKIIEDPELKYFKINVDTTKGNVVFTGFVRNKRAEERLIEIAKSIRGVKSVISHLKIENQQ